MRIRTEKLATLAFPEEVKSNAVIQAQLADLYVEALQNGRIRHEAPIKLSAVLAKESQGMWKKANGEKAQGQKREVGRQEGGKGNTMWNKKVKLEEKEPGE